MIYHPFQKTDFMSAVNYKELPANTRSVRLEVYLTICLRTNLMTLKSIHQPAKNLWRIISLKSKYMNDSDILEVSKSLSLCDENLYNPTRKLKMKLLDLILM